MFWHYDQISVFSTLFSSIESISLVNHVKQKQSWNSDAKERLLAKQASLGRQQNGMVTLAWISEKCHFIGECRQRYINVLSNGKVIQTLMFTLQTKCGRGSKSVFSSSFDVMYLRSYFFLQIKILFFFANIFFQVQYVFFRNYWMGTRAITCPLSKISKSQFCE